MLVLTLVFVVLYGSALLGWLKPLPDEKMVVRLEPIIFVIIGYYLGRQNERTLNEEIGRQTQKADTAQHFKEQALQSREVAEEKIKNVTTALTSPAPASSVARFAEDIQESGSPVNEEVLRNSVVAALRILTS